MFYAHAEKLINLFIENENLYLNLFKICQFVSQHVRKLPKVNFSHAWYSYFTYAVPF